MAPRSLRPPFAALAPLLLLLAPPAAHAAGVGQIDMKVCTGASCNSGCTDWTAENGKCAPGTSGNGWVSSITTLSSDAATATWQLYFDSAASHTCALANFAPSCNATFIVDGDCHTATLCGGTLTVSYRANGPTPGWVIAVIVIFGVIVPIACLCACGYACCRPGGCCNPQKSVVVTPGMPAAGLNINGGAPGGAAPYGGQYAGLVQMPQQGGGVYYAQPVGGAGAYAQPYIVPAPPLGAYYGGQQQQQGIMQPMGYTAAATSYPEGFVPPAGGGYPARASFA